jgi:dimethylhistidine N-methyltransferase
MTSVNSAPATAALPLYPVEDTPSTEDAFLRDVLQGLRRSPRQIPCKYFYDDRGSRLFTEICRTREYYITRTEIALLKEILPAIAALTGNHATVIEFGSGEGRKIRDLLSALPQPSAYVPIDISAEILLSASHQLQREFPQVAVHPVVGDYTAPIQLPTAVTRNGDGRRLVFFPGSTISNFKPAEAREFLGNLQTFLRPGDGLLLGVDLLKSPARLHSAYNDQQGVTAQFNLNLLQRINTELGANFVIKNFEHYAFFNPAKSRIEMHLVSLCHQVVTIADEEFHFAQGDPIHTENSYKYSVEDVINLGADCGFQHLQVWTDRERLFSIHYLQAASDMR